ncbi:MAG: TRAP transporter permease, partial [Gammaproteobacteria bacterium]|nr:TRAP transporter permease [Gammaproteobacteria bacterium]
MTEHPSGTLDIEAAEALEKQYDSSLVTRENGPALTQFLYYFAIAFAFYHIWTAGFGTPVDHLHMGIHLTGLFILIFASFPFIRTQSALELRQATLWRWGNIPVYDWLFAAVGVTAALFLALSWSGLTL